MNKEIENLKNKISSYTQKRVERLLHYKITVYKKVLNVFVCLRFILCTVAFCNLVVEGVSKGALAPLRRRPFSS